MPRKTMSRIVDRKKMILTLLENGELPTSAIVKKTRLTHSQVFYVLRMLLRERKVEGIKRGKVTYWRKREER